MPTGHEKIRAYVESAYRSATRDADRSREALDRATTNSYYYRQLIRRNLSEAHGRVNALADILREIDTLDVRR